MAETGAKIAERMLTRAQGATMDEIIAATGGPQYNVLKRLEARGFSVRKVREGRGTRYFVKPPANPTYEFSVNDKGQVTLPKGLREEMRVYEGQKLEASVENGNLVVKKKGNSITRLAGVLGKAKRHVSLKEMDEIIAQAAVDRFLRAVGEKK
jgi:AbrB family looped-hinge helix DNA binding protein